MISRETNAAYNKKEFLQWKHKGEVKKMVLTFGRTTLGTENKEPAPFW